eukprot:GGOE01054378.1.p1 GENE.GGOE01054378.1~~GGOE01054378.1.p1  ORF type:complete len:171 (+),score=16.25 GGOE01054378.1:108-620(+)
MSNPRLYLAGPDVFRKDPQSHFAQMARLCTVYGCVGLCPFDAELTYPTAASIFQGNVGLIDSCDYVVANLVPFRGCGVDDGTAFEIGYGFSHGKVCYGYLVQPELDLKTRTAALMAQLSMEDGEFPVIEDFGSAVNLMLTESIRCSGGTICDSFEGCLQAIQSRHKTIPP